MATFLFDDIVFGPIKSRRFGNSLGINLLPENKKICNFNCVYCECGWTDKSSIKLYSSKHIITRMVDEFKRLSENNTKVDTITFAGNGEPTMHPDFDIIIDDCIKLRNRFFPQANISVLSNATLLNREKVKKALSKIELSVLKLDSAIETTVNTINKPFPGFQFKTYLENLRNLKNKPIIQTMFIKYNKGGIQIDNTSEKELNALITEYRLIAPSLIMIYSIARDTPDDGVEKISKVKLNEISEIISKEGFQTEVY